MLCWAAFSSPPAASAPPAADSREYLVSPSIPYGSRIARTMRLLATSTPQHKHRVRILFYGQSITGGWTDLVLKDLRTRFPNADIVAENHAIGGFSAPWLSQTAEADLYPWYPDLLFLQDYGALDPAMERMFAAVRNRTTAEVLAFTHHLDAGSQADQVKNTGESARIRELSDTACLESAHQIFKKPVPIGFKVVWKVYALAADEWKPQPIADPAKENLYTLAQGLPNGKHVLEIIPAAAADLPIRYLVVYEPTPPAGR